MVKIKKQKEDKVMTQEEKDLLLKDLCTRLPYGVIIQEYNEEYGYADNALNTIGMGYFSIHEAGMEGTWINRIENVRPYLRPMSSMTEEECIELGNIDATIENISELIPNVPYYIEVASSKQIDWLNKKMFDYRGLIEKGLAIEVTEENNPYK